MTAGMAATSPSAVASKASAMPGATTARLVVWDSEMPMNAFMMPHTVPNRPTNGAVAPMVARMPAPRVTCRVIAVSTRSSRKATLSLKPSSMMPPDSSASRAVEVISCATASRASPQALSASARLSPASSILIRRSARRLADRSSMVLASQTVQVTSEAKASPTITAFTTMSALRNMPHGERLRGNSAVGACASAACEIIAAIEARLTIFAAAKALARRSSRLRSSILVTFCVILFPCRSYLLCNAEKESAPGPELGCEHADARAVPDFVDRVEEVHDVEAEGRGLVWSDDVEVVRNTDIELRVGRHVIGIGKAGPQSAAVNHRGTELRPFPEVGGAGGCRQLLGMIGGDGVRCDEGQFVGRKEKLVGYDVLADLRRPRQIAVSAEIAVDVVGLEFKALVASICIVESGQHIGCPELAVVEQVARKFVVRVDSDFEAGYRINLLHDADVEDIRSLGQHRIVDRHGGRLRVGGRGWRRDQCQMDRGRDHLHGWCKVSRVADVERGAVGRFPGQADARAELIGV